MNKLAFYWGLGTLFLISPQFYYLLNGQLAFPPGIGRALPISIMFIGWGFIVIGWGHILDDSPYDACTGLVSIG